MIYSNILLCETNWSEIPNWIQAVGVVFASIGLVITLLLQRKTLKEQQIITKLEQKRFLDSYLPILEIENILYERDGQKYEVKFDIVIKEKGLRNFKIHHNFPNYFIIDIPYYISDVILPVGKVLSFKIFYELEPVIVEMKEYSGNTIIFDFEDSLGNKYQQYLIYKGADSLFIHPAIHRR